ncbi:hypothetical protein FDP41_013527 [Naegleria fowleri]|uniref:PPIase cyclophilin-type domain-containing protein n=1 Tax=Naegleria fowleri TaxID=5763 RepID=A0A6A5BQI5_NAEFO|nr:uncharacterized protein FDP41_013527 [Naegleria fowleri]KAF0980313.1 hypothetical protein FDP41_013527 [Naegleria fowleri]
MPSHSKKHGHLYVRSSELASRRKASEVERKIGKSLPFYHCCLTSQPITGEPVATRDGYMFDILNILPWIRKHHIHPITGEPLEMNDLIRLHIKMNEEGKPYCPATNRIFTEQSHIVAIAKTGNVYSWNGIENLNLTEGDVMHDVLTNEEFTKDDIITIQDPKNPRDITTMHHQAEKKIQEEKKRRASEDSSNLEKVSEYINLNSSTSKVLEEMERRKKKKLESNEEEQELKSNPLRGGEQSFGILSSDTKASSLTSSVMNVRTKSHESEKINEQYWKDKTAQYDRIKKQFKDKKAYVSLHTNFGDLNFELYPYLCPQTCDNFIELCNRKYYDGVKFHRLIKGFMIQGGDPTGTGRGGKSIWNSDFKDEISGKLRHDGFGVLSMANRGPNTNSSQFFITFKAVPHLDNKHTVFGRLVGGSKVLEHIEKIKTDEEDRPLEDIVIEKTSVFYSPFAEDAKIQRELAESQQVINIDFSKSAATSGMRNSENNTSEHGHDSQQFGHWFSNPSGLNKKDTIQRGDATHDRSVGKYLKLKTSNSNQQESSDFIQSLTRNSSSFQTSSSSSLMK